MNVYKTVHLVSIPRVATFVCPANIKWRIAILSFLVFVANGPKNVNVLTFVGPLGPKKASEAWKLASLLAKSCKGICWIYCVLQCQMRNPPVWTFVDPFDNEIYIFHVPALWDCLLQMLKIGVQGSSLRRGIKNKVISSWRCSKKWLKKRRKMTICGNTIAT